jgi:DNA-binding response OmpR family regulator
MANPKILLVEDERDLAFILSANFKNEGFDFHTAETAEAGLNMARKLQPALVISDITLPGMDGLEMVRLLRQESQVPVLFLTARKDEVNRILGFKLGADDYLGKPFSMQELICRVKAILHRASPRSSASRQASLRVGGIEIDLRRHEVRVNGKHRPVTPRELQILTLLIEADGKAISREDLLKRLWGSDESMDVNTRTIDQHIARLRRSLLGEKRRLVTVKSVGYKIMTDVP